MAGLEDIDLTLEAIFVGQERTALLLRDAFNYYRNTTIEDGRSRIFSQHRGFSLFVGNDEDFEDLDDDYFDEDISINNSIHLCHQIFGSFPQWFEKLSPLYMLEEYEGCNCHRCGVELNLLNKRFWTCLDCNEQMSVKSVSIFS